MSAEQRFTQYAQSKRQVLEKSTFRRLTQRPSSVQLWQTPTGTLTPKVELSPRLPFPPGLPLPDEAQDASYFAEEERIANFSANSIQSLYICIVINARGHFNALKPSRDSNQTGMDFKP